LIFILLLHLLYLFEPGTDSVASSFIVAETNTTKAQHYQLSLYTNY